MSVGLNELGGLKPKVEARAIDEFLFAPPLNSGEIARIGFAPRVHLVVKAFEFPLTAKWVGRRNLILCFTDALVLVERFYWSVML